MGRSRLRIAVLVVAATLAGCGGSSLPQPGSPTGQYAGERDGLGAMVDFRGDDATAARIRELLGADGPRVALAYIVNRQTRPITVPTFTAQRFDGRLTVLRRADQQQSLDRLGLPHIDALAPNEAGTIYLLYSGSPSAFTRIAMRSGIERDVTLRPQSADGSQPQVPDG